MIPKMAKEKIFVIFIAALFIVSIVPFALAQDNYSNSSEVVEDVVEIEEVQNDFSEEELDEVEVMQYTQGQVYRLTQLKNSIQKAIIMGESVLENLDKISEEDYATFERILSDLESLVGVIGDVDYSVSVEELANTFVEIKRESIILIKEFKDLSRTYVNEEKATELREKLKEKNKERIQEMRSMIKEKVMENLAENARRFMEKFGILDEDLIGQYQNGKINNSDFRHSLNEKIKSFSEENREKVGKELKEERENLKERIKSVENKKYQLKEKIEEKRNEFRSNLQEKIKDRLEMRKNQELNQTKSNSKLGQGFRKNNSGGDDE